MRWRRSASVTGPASVEKAPCHRGTFRALSPPCCRSGGLRCCSPARRRTGRVPSSAAGGLALLLVVAGLLFFSRLHAPLLEPQESRYAEIPRQMLAQAELLTPVLNGQPYLDKPPLLYWAVMASYTVFGVHDWAARLVPALAGLFTVLVTYVWGRCAVGERAGLCGRWCSVCRRDSCTWNANSRWTACSVCGPRRRWRRRTRPSLAAGFTSAGGCFRPARAPLGF